MAIGTRSDFKVYNEQFFGGYVEALEQNANAFNGASANAIQLVPNRLLGDFEKESFIKSISALATRRDVGVTTGVTDTAMSQGEFASVKLNRRIGPVANTMDSFRKIGRDPAEISFILGQQIGQAVAIEMVDATLTALNSALSTAMTHDASAVTPPDETGPKVTHTNMVTAMALMGDRSNRIVAWVMHSKNYFDLVKQAIADKIFEVAGVTIYSGNVATFNRPVVVTDSASLALAASKYAVLGLVQGAAIVQESEVRDVVSDTVTGLENLVIRIQGEYAYNLGLRGFTWDTTAGGVNPDGTALALATNWDASATDVKSGPGVRLVTL